LPQKQKTGAFLEEKNQNDNQLHASMNEIDKNAFDIEFDRNIRSDTKDFKKSGT
jgi:hypothetical protein